MAGGDKAIFFLSWLFRGSDQYNGMTLYTPLSGDCGSLMKDCGSWDVPPESRASATEGSLWLQHRRLVPADPCAGACSPLPSAPGSEDILGGTQSAPLSGHPGDNSTATQIN